MKANILVSLNTSLVCWIFKIYVIHFYSQGENTWCRYKVGSERSYF